MAGDKGSDWLEDGVDKKIAFCIDATEEWPEGEQFPLWSIEMCRSNKVDRFKGYGLVLVEVEGRPDTFKRVGLLTILDVDWFKCPSKWSQITII